MKKWVVGLVLGTIVGILGALPLIMQGAPTQRYLGLLAHWIGAGIIIVASQTNIPSWLKGLVFAELIALPVIVTMPVRVVFMITIGSAVVGPIIAVLGDKFAPGN
jgi:hypothetical protein